MDGSQWAVEASIDPAVLGAAEKPERVAQTWAIYRHVTEPLKKLSPVIHTVGRHDHTRTLRQVDVRPLLV